MTRHGGSTSAKARTALPLPAARALLISMEGQTERIGKPLRRSAEPRESQLPLAECRTPVHWDQMGKGELLDRRELATGMSNVDKRIT
jgi:hypothetical protein